MRILGLMAIKNECQRYLQACLAWHDAFDGLLVCDDQSWDPSPKIAASFATVVVRPDGVPSFMDNERIFRNWTMEELANNLKPEPGDWIISIDADEFFVDLNTIDWLTEEDEYGNSIDGYSVPLKEVWDFKAEPWVGGRYDHGMKLRVDGWWKGQLAPRIWRWHPNASIFPSPLAPEQRLACGSIPSTVQNVLVAKDASLLHFGYASEGDRKTKYERYLNQPGHSPAHIRSIIETPVLADYIGTVPRAWRGVH